MSKAIKKSTLDLDDREEKIVLSDNNASTDAENPFLRHIESQNDTYSGDQMKFNGSETDLSSKNRLPESHRIIYNKGANWRLRFFNTFKTLAAISRPLNEQASDNETHTSTVHTFSFCILTDFTLSISLLRTIWVIQSSLVSPGNATLSFLGVFSPMYFGIINVIFEYDIEYGCSSVMYCIYTGIRLSLIYGLAYTAPMIYNSSRASFFPFFIFLVILRLAPFILSLASRIYYKCISRYYLINSVVDLLVAGLYLASLIVQAIRPLAFDFVYRIWAAGVTIDFISLFSRRYFNFCDRNRSVLSPRNEIQYVDEQFHVTQSNKLQYFPNVHFRLNILILGILIAGISQVFQERHGVGLPDVYCSTIYDMMSFFMGLCGFIVIFCLSRMYLRDVISHFSTQDIAYEQTLGSYAFYLLHLLLAPAVILFITGLQMTLSTIWDVFSGLAPPGAFYQFNLSPNTYVLSIWPYLPVPSIEGQMNFLNQWVAQQPPPSNYSLPPGVFQTGTSSTGTSRLSYIKSCPDVILCAGLGAVILIMSAIKVIHKWNQCHRTRTQKINTHDDSSIFCKQISKTFWSIVIGQSLVGITISIFSAINISVFPIIWKLLASTALVLLQLIFSEALLLKVKDI